MRELHVLTRAFPHDPALDAALSAAVMRRVAAGELPETLRIASAGPVVAFGKRDRLAPGCSAAVVAAGELGMGAVLRLGGGRAAVFHEGTLELSHAVPDPDPRSGIEDRFELMAGAIVGALGRLGVCAQVGEVPGEYCPGRYSVGVGGRRKLAGIGQRVISGGSHTGAAIVVDDAERVRRVLVPVYRALDLQWDPATVGAVTEEARVSLEDVRGALLEEYAGLRRLVHAEPDPATLALARRLAPQHRIES